eukprot:4335250-Prymnesium_polylepis.1
MSALRGCMGAWVPHPTSARCAPVAADGAWCHVSSEHINPHLAHVPTWHRRPRVSIGLGRRSPCDVREHRWHAGEPRHQRCVWHLYTIKP